jgi:serine/threonine protein kinase
VYFLVTKRFGWMFAMWRTETTVCELAPYL